MHNDTAASLDRLTAERNYLLDRSMRAGSISFGGERDTGRSSNALVRFAIAGKAIDETDYPSDPSDLAACFLARDRAPAHLQPAMDRMLVRYRAHVARRYPEVATSDAFRRQNQSRGIPLSEFADRLREHDGPTIDEDGRGSRKPTRREAELERALRAANRKLDLLERYGAAKFGDEWWPARADAFLSMAEAEILEVLEADTTSLLGEEETRTSTEAR